MIATNRQQTNEKARYKLYRLKKIIFRSDLSEVLRRIIAACILRFVQGEQNPLQEGENDLRFHMQLQVVFHSHGSQNQYPPS